MIDNKKEQERGTFVKYVNAGEVEAGNENFDYSKLDDAAAKEAREDLV